MPRDPQPEVKILSQTITRISEFRENIEKKHIIDVKGTVAWDGF